VEFDFDSSTIRPEFKVVLDNLGRALKGPLKDAVIKIVGHTDSIGDEDYNQALSERRAQAVAAFLRDRHGYFYLLTEGRGEREPIASNATAEGRQRNRRVQFIRVGTFSINTGRSNAMVVVGNESLTFHFFSNFHQ